MRPRPHPRPQQQPQQPQQPILTALPPDLVEVEPIEVTLDHLTVENAERRWETLWQDLHACLRASIRIIHTCQADAMSRDRAGSPISPAERERLCRTSEILAELGNSIIGQS